MAAAQVAFVRQADLDRHVLLSLEVSHGYRHFRHRGGLISVTGALLGAPAYYRVDEGIDFGIWRVDELWEAIVLTLIEIPLFS